MSSSHRVEISEMSFAAIIQITLPIEPFAAACLLACRLPEMQPETTDCVSMFVAALQLQIPQHDTVQKQA